MQLQANSACNCIEQVGGCAWPRGAGDHPEARALTVTGFLIIPESYISVATR
mgnify:CR=1 FL=1